MLKYLLINVFPVFLPSIASTLTKIVALLFGNMYL